MQGVARWGTLCADSGAIQSAGHAAVRSLDAAGTSGVGSFDSAGCACVRALNPAWLSGVGSFDSAGCPSIGALNPTWLSGVGSFDSAGCRSVRSLNASGSSVGSGKAAATGAQAAWSSPSWSGHRGAVVEVRGRTGCTIAGRTLRQRLRLWHRRPFEPGHSLRAIKRAGQNWQTR